MHAPHTTTEGHTVSITYLTGVVTTDLLAVAADYPNLGLLAQPGNRIDKHHAVVGGRMGLDNGCFSKGDDFDLDGYLAHIATVTADGCQPMWATAPDVVGDYQATTRRSLPVLAQIRQLGVPVAYVAQNGMEHDLDRVRWDLFDVLFVGGSPECRTCSWVRPQTDFRSKACPAGHALVEWKTSEHAAAVVAAAKAHGKQVHMGRVNSLKRLRIAQAMGCDTADGTYLKFGRKGENLPKMLGWLTQLAADDQAAELAAAA